MHFSAFHCCIAIQVLKHFVHVDKINFIFSDCEKVYRGPYRKWDNVALINAMKAVESGLSYKDAKDMYNVPISTLHDYVTGKVPVGSRSGPKPYLSVEEEEELASFLFQVAQIGYPHTKKQVFGIVQRILESKGIHSPVSNGWWERFCKRNPSVSLRAAVALSVARASATDPEMLHRYYDTLEQCLKDNDIFNQPGVIFNCDETGLSLNPSSLRVVQQVGTKNPSYITGCDKSQITVLACTCAAGYALPPMVIFDRLTWNPKLAEGEIAGCFYGLSKNGWINRELFDKWFSNHFLKYAPQSRPLLLLLDGHSSHYSPATINLAAEQGILVYVLPPNTTHLTQPLDKGCFAPLKVLWRQACHDFRRDNPGRVVTRFEFSQLFSEVWYSAMSARNIVASFKTTGVCPFNRQALKVPGMEKEEPTIFQPNNLAERTGLKLIPLYSPSRPTPRKIISSQADTPQVAPVVTMKNIDSTPKFSVNRVPPPDTIGGRFFRAASVPLRTATTMSSVLTLPVPPSADPNKPKKSCGGCLTSGEGLRQFQEKARLKEEKVKLKEEKAKLREERKKQREEQKQNKKRKPKKGKLIRLCWYYLIV